MLSIDLSTALSGCKFGVEKESLRADRNANIAATTHPKSLGSKLTHTMITTDYAEAQLELITPALNSIAEVKSWLLDLHGYTASCLENEYIWPASMPCLLPEDDQIAIADYGTSNSGLMKMAYRRGLAHRYGKHMQTISGLHFNMSFGNNMWEQLAALRNTTNTRAFRDECYMGLVRNFVRHVWLVALLFGSSPAFAVNFLKNRQDLRPTVVGRIADHTWLADHATSLRMSEVGYKNASQQHLHASYDSLAEYLRDLDAATTTTDPRFERFGVLQDGVYQQLNTNIIQIEAEYYGSVRPKNPVKRCERPIAALASRGIEYIEARAIDINPLSAIGIEDCGLYWLPSFMTWCLLTDSPALSMEERRESNLNLLKVVHEGRDADVNLHRHTEQINAHAWATQIFAELDTIATAFSNSSGDPAYTAAQQEQRKRLQDYNLLPASRVLEAMAAFDNEHIATNFSLAQQHTTAMRQQAGGARRAELQALCAQSLQQQQALEDDRSVDFAEYLRRYFAGKCD